MGDLPKGRPILCVDFDGVIHSYESGWKGPRTIPDSPVPGAIRFLHNAQKHFQVCIFSSRSRYFGGRRAMRNWLRKWLLTRQCVREIKFPTRKPPAFLLIDDRAFVFKGHFPDPELLLNFKPWNKGGDRL